MRRLAIVVVLAISAGRFAAAAGSLSGAWLFGDDRPEPKESVVSLAPRCWNGGVDFTLAENGKKLTGEARWTEPSGGVARNSSRDESETLAGTRDGDHVVLTGRHVVVTTDFAFPSVPDSQQTGESIIKYDLRLNRKTGHLVGTRDGQPFWLARFRTHHADCGSPPP
ncbi:MAG TPA: hypothetical protein VLC06_08375 [Polyangia bacterium]|jgi:hypothetical protein|nr:hypothetical protein [Polyangia bacterium]